jgi:hypothetical protein
VQATSEKWMGRTVVHHPKGANKMFDGLLMFHAEILNE